MVGYRRVWLAGWSVLGLAGLLVGIVAHPWATNVALFALAAFAGGVVCLMVRRETVTLRGLALARSTAAWTVTSGAGAVAVGGLVALSVSATVLLLFLAAGTSPWAVQRFVRLVRRDDADQRARARLELVLSQTDPRTRLGLGPPVADLTDAQLCHAWRISFAVLQDLPTAASRGRVVDLRQAYLDELERRDPSAFSAWLEAGARAAGSPDRYFVGRPPDDHGHHREAG